MSADLHIANLLRLASEDLRGARLLATERNRNAIYLCEQAAEKVILAVLTSEGKHGQHKHQLDQFVDLIPDENPVRPMLKAIEHLTAYATTYRYPTTTGKIKAGPQGPAFDVEADRVALALNSVAARLGVDLEQPDAPARTPAPIR